MNDGSPGLSFSTGSSSRCGGVRSTHNLTEDRTNSPGHGILSLSLSLSWLCMYSRRQPFANSITSFENLAGAAIYHPTGETKRLCLRSQKKNIYKKRILSWLDAGTEFLCSKRASYFHFASFLWQHLKEKRERNNGQTHLSLMNVPDVQSDNNSCSQFQQHSTRCN